MFPQQNTLPPRPPMLPGGLAGILAALSQHSQPMQPAMSISPLAQAAAGDYPTVGPHTPPRPELQPRGGLPSFAGPQPFADGQSSLATLLPLLLQRLQQPQLQSHNPGLRLT